MPSRWKLALIGPLAASLAMLPVIGLAQEPPIKAEVDRNEVAVNDVLTLTVTVTGAQVVPNPALPQMDGVDVTVLSRSSASQLSIFSGKTTVLAVSHYRLKPLSPGTLTIAPISVTVAGVAHETEPITVVVHAGAFTPRPDPEPAPGNVSVTEAFFVEADVDNPNPYIGEQIDYIFRFHSVLGFVNPPRYDSPPFIGFWHEGETDSRRYEMFLNERQYGVIELRTALFPTVTGTLTIEPTRYGFPSAGFRSSRQLLTDTVRVDVRPLPSGAPAGFDGAVGQLDIDAKVDVASAAVNEPVTLTVIVSGAGNIETLPDPHLPDVVGWRSFVGPPAVDTQAVDGRIIGSRSIERIFVPSAEGEFVIPAISYSYFDPETELYETVSTDPISVSVTPGSDDAPPPIQAGRDEVERVGTDIRHIMPAPSILEQPDEPIVERPTYWAAWALPLLVILAGTGWKVLGNARRRRAAAGVAAHTTAMMALEDARHRDEDPYDTAAAVLTSYLSEMLGQPVSGLTHHALAKLLVDRGVDEGLVETVESYVATTERVRFAPGSAEGISGDSVLDEAARLLADLDGYFA
jgi:hypothetical protein